MANAEVWKKRPAKKESEVLKPEEFVDSAITEKVKPRIVIGREDAKRRIKEQKLRGQLSVLKDSNHGNREVTNRAE